MSYKKKYEALVALLYKTGVMSVDGEWAFLIQKLVKEQEES